MTKKEKVQQMLNLQQQGITYKEMTDEECERLIGYKQKKALHKAMREEGYIYNKELGIFVLSEYCKCNTDIIQKNEIEQYNSNTVVLQEGIIDYLRNEDKAIKLFNLINRADDLIKLLDNETVVEESIRLTLDTEEELVQANFRMYKSIKEQFQEFCKKHKAYKTQELISQALKEFMEKYN